MSNFCTKTVSIRGDPTIQRQDVLNAATGPSIDIVPLNCAPIGPAAHMILRDGAISNAIKDIQGSHGKVIAILDAIAQFKDFGVTNVRIR